MTKKEGNCLPVKAKQIKEAVKVLKEYIKKWDEENPSRKKPLLEEPSQTPILLNFTLKKIPELSKIQMIKAPLPHTLVTDVTDVCLFTGDLDKKDTKADVEPTIQHYKELLSKHGVKSVSEVIPLRQLRTEYRQYEAKRNLYGAYDYFLADNRISQCLPRILGKFFFGKRKFPQQINLSTSNLKYQVENALSRTVFFLTGRGNSCSAEVAHVGFTTKQITENIESAVNAVAANIPGTWKNINGLYIKTPLSVSIPLYLSSESGNDVELPSPETIEDVEAEELTTLKGYKVKVYGDGNVELVKVDEGSSDNESDREYVEALLKETELLDEDDYKRRKVRKKKKSWSDDDDDEEEVEDEEESEIMSRKSEKLKRKFKTGKAKFMVSKMDEVENEDKEDEEAETISRENEKLKRKIDTGKAKFTVTKMKKRHMDEVENEDKEGEETETVPRGNEKLKKKGNTGKAKSMMKKKNKRYMDEVDDETETVITKKKKKVPK